MNLATTVVLPAQREGNLLRLAISSIKRQTYAAWKMLVVLDDADEVTREVAKASSYRDERISVIETRHNNLGEVLSQATMGIKTEFITRMDADDYSHPNRLLVQISHMRQNPNTVISGSNVRFIDEAGVPFGHSNNRTAHVDICKELRNGRGGALFHPSTTIRTEALEGCGGYNGRFPRGEDLDLFLRLSEIGHLSNIKSRLLDFRKHRNSSTASEDLRTAKLRRLAIVSEHYARSNTSPPTPNTIMALRSFTAAEEDRSRLLTAIRQGYGPAVLKYAIRTAAHLTTNTAPSKSCEQ